MVFRGFSDFVCFASLRTLIGLAPPLDQSDEKLKAMVSWSPVLSALQKVGLSYVVLIDS